MNLSGLQLEMNLENSGNRFREQLDRGQFSVLIEVSAPGKDTDFANAAERLAEFEQEALSIKDIPVSLAVTDKYLFLDSWSAADFATALSKENRDRHLVYISGRNSSYVKTREMIKLCVSNGIINVVPVTGDSVRGESFRETRKRQFTESIHLLKHISTLKEPQFFPGCVFNPMKYTPADIFAQYFKLIKKLNLGANFIVTQVGWDMLKLQEMRWYLIRRGMPTPSFARLMVLTPEKVEKILSGYYPGIKISSDFQEILSNELHYSSAQFESAQWRRLQLQAAGCRLLGFSGIQLAGLESPQKISIAVKRITEGIVRFSDYEEWLKEYYEHYGRAEMAPYPFNKYIFDGLFKASSQFSGSPRMANVKIPELSSSKKILYALRKVLFPHADRQSPGEHLLSKKLFAGCRGCSYCRLPLSFFVCPELCPKGLANGPCGGTRPDGTCEVGNRECEHAGILKIAAWQKRIDFLEDTYIPPAGGE